MAKVFLLEDDSDTRTLVETTLRQEAHLVSCFNSVEDVPIDFSFDDLDIAMIDWMLPGTSGLAYVRALRARGLRSLTIIIVSARTDNASMIEALDAGADDYLAKPFEPEVLLARVRALLRRQQIALNEFRLNELRAGELTLNLATHEAHCAGRLLALTNAEFLLLRALLEKPDRVVVRDRLLGVLQNANLNSPTELNLRAVDSHVFGLRRKLGEFAGLLETRRGIGYILRSTLKK